PLEIRTVAANLRHVAARAIAAEVHRADRHNTGGCHRGINGCHAVWAAVSPSTNGPLVRPPGRQGVDRSGLPLLRPATAARRHRSTDDARAATADARGLRLVPPTAQVADLRPRSGNHCDPPPVGTGRATPRAQPGSRQSAAPGGVYARWRRR